jgi:alpha-L-fucosidase
MPGDDDINAPVASRRSILAAVSGSILGLAGCSGDDTSTDTAGLTDTATGTSTERPGETTDAPTDPGTPTDDPTPTEGPTPTEEPTPTATPASYEPTWDSLAEHDVPDWFHDAKLGIFIHWGPYSAPGWGPIGEYAEWYPREMHMGGATASYHREHYGEPVPGDDIPEEEVFEYKDFIRDTDGAADPDATENFDAADWDPGRWADLFDEVGAGYVVPVGEHHDGFPMWAAEDTDWNAAEKGPERDVIKELSEAVRDRGMKYAASYHRMLNYYDPRYTGKDGHPGYDDREATDAFVEEWKARWRDLMDHVKPDLLWWDGDWFTPASRWDSKEMVAEYYNTAANEWGKEVAVNDRLGEVREEHGDFYTPEYETYDEVREHKWEANRGIGSSFGYNRQEDADDHLSVEEIVQSFVDIVSKNGNLLLNVGPKANGRIPELQRERLEGFGAWLDSNGEALFGTDPWEQPADTVRDVEARYTTDGDHVYAIMFGWPEVSAPLSVPQYETVPDDASVVMLGVTGNDGEPRELDWQITDDGLLVGMPSDRPTGDHAGHAYTLRVEIE